MRPSRGMGAVMKSKKPGGAKEGQPIPAKKPGKLGQRARLAETLKKMK
jgi:hypothetical protein